MGAEEENHKAVVEKVQNFKKKQRSFWAHTWYAKLLKNKSTFSER